MGFGVQRWELSKGERFFLFIFKHGKRKSKHLEFAEGRGGV